MMCNPWYKAHKWNKWEIVVVKSYGVIEDKNKRVCERCGYTQRTDVY